MKTSPNHLETAPDRETTVSPPAPSPEAVAAAERVVAQGGARGRLGVVLGTGLGGIADRLAGRFAMAAHDTGYLPRSLATGHAGRIVTGRIAGCPAIVLQGRVHGYEGFGRNPIVRGVELLAALGAETVVLTNAAGGLAPSLVAGEIVVLEDHVDLARIPPAAIPPAAPRCDVAIERAGRMAAAPYDLRLIDVAMEAARAANAPARRGVYAHLTGPSYETRAEYRMLRRLGADVVGMSTVPEAVAAGSLGLGVLAVSVVTNVARPDRPAATDAEEVCRAAEAAAEGVWAIVSAVAATIGGDPCGY